MSESTEQQNIIVGVAWYRPDQWQRIRDISIDGDEMEDSYEEWLLSAEQFLKEFSGPGKRFEKVDVDSEQLILWCNTRGLEVNAKARSQYVADKVRQMDKTRR